MITPSIFFDNRLYKSGENQCFYCGAPCDESYTVKEYVKPKFTNRDIVFRPGSSFVCGGCVESFNETTTITMPDGEVRDRQRVRGYSWVITSQYKQAYTKAHIKQLRELCLNPPEPPFAIILADSGQKHLIFRSKINLSKHSFFVMLEETQIIVEPDKLRERIELLEKFIPFTGKPGLKEEIKTTTLEKIFDYYGESETISLLEKYNNVKEEQITNLALWLARNKEDSINARDNK
jgi:CRISPR type IV-associated protein Csf1